MKYYGPMSGFSPVYVGRLLWSMELDDLARGVIQTLLLQIGCLHSNWGARFLLFSNCRKWPGLKRGIQDSLPTQPGCVLQN